MFTFQRCSGKETASGVAVLISLKIVLNISVDKTLLFQQQGRKRKQTKVVIHRKHRREANDSPPANNKAGLRYRQMGYLGPDKAPAKTVSVKSTRRKTEAAESPKMQSDGLLEMSPFVDVFRHVHE